MGGFENLFLERIPGFTLEKGEFHSESPIDFTIGGVVRVKADSSVEQFKGVRFSIRLCTGAFGWKEEYFD